MTGLLRGASNAFDAAAEASLSPSDGEAMAIRAMQSSDAVARLYARLYARTLPAAAQRAYDGLTPERAVRRGPEADIWLAAVRAFLRDEAGALIRRVSATLVSEVRRVLAEGVEAGEGMGALARRLRRAVPGLARIRALVIARTETITASNLGAWLGAQTTAGEYGITLEKEWLATSDERTRDSHADANGQRRPLDDPFSINGYDAQHPGDTALPAEERVQCRCAVAFIPIG